MKIEDTLELLDILVWIRLNLQVINDPLLAIVFLLEKILIEKVNSRTWWQDQM